MVHMPMFNMANYRWQVIVAAELPDDVRGIKSPICESSLLCFFTQKH